MKKAKAQNRKSTSTKGVAIGGLVGLRWDCDKDYDETAIGLR